MHISEIQSDWGQKGKKEGFKPSSDKELNDIIKERENVYKPFTDKEQEALAEYEKKQLEKEKQRMDKVKEQFGTDFLIQTQLLNEFADYSSTKQVDDTFIREIK